MSKRAHRTHTEEFYEVTDSNFEIADLSGGLLEWERTYNTVRPHQALGYLTPLKSLGQQEEGRSSVTNHMDENKGLTQETGKTKLKRLISTFCGIGYLMGQRSTHTWITGRISLEN